MMVTTTGEWVPVLDPVQVAMAALCEAGRPDLAANVTGNRSGWPGLRARDADEQEVIVRAFLIAHRSVHPTAFRDAESGGITCPVCYPDLFFPGTQRKASTA